MLEIQMKDGTVFRPENAGWSILLPSGQAYSWEDVQRISMVECTYVVSDGVFGPPGAQQMPIRGVRFTDMSDLTFEVPMPLEVAIEMGEKLMSRKLEVVRHLPFTKPG